MAKDTQAHHNLQKFKKQLPISSESSREKHLTKILKYNWSKDA